MTDENNLKNYAERAAGVFLLEAFDRDTGSMLYVKGREIMSVNYDEHGPSGATLIRSAAERLSSALGPELDQDEVDDDLYQEIITFLWDPA